MNDGLVVAAPLAPGASVEQWKTAIRALSIALGWSRPGTPAFSSVIGPADRVLVKPNWVMHLNKGPWGLGPLITAPELVIATAELALENGPLEVILGDAPLQACDVEALWRHGAIAAWADRQRAAGARLRGPLDFRRTIAIVDGAVLRQSTDRRAIEAYRLVNLGADSLLEPVTNADRTFRVTQYPPDLMHARHRPRHHEYLIASEVLEATVILNLPKLKTHKKAGVTAALKNLVGINGNKEFLPHHRVGSPAEGGDCYPRPNPFKRLQERLYDVQNRLTSVLVKKALRYPIGAIGLLGRYHRERFGLEGAWSGNDTVWRMALDLNRVLLHADRDGVLQDAPQRRELHLVDAVVAGQGDGPLAAEPFPLGLVLGASNAAAADWIGARLLGYRPERIHLVRESFGRFRFPVASFAPSAVRVESPSGAPIDIATCVKPTRYPEGWVDAVESAGRDVPPVGTTFGRARPQGGVAPVATAVGAVEE